MSIDTIPLAKIFYPTESEFSNFTKYMEYCDGNCDTGIMKIIPPKSFVARKDNYNNFDYKIPHPIEQNVNGSNGIYNLLLFTQSGRSFQKYSKSILCKEKSIYKKSYSELENLFWKTIKYSEPLYGSDSPGSIFDSEAKWNLSNLDNPLKAGLNFKDLKGITSPYLYFGCWKSLFCFHKEDMDLSSINYMHFGKAKHWYGIPENQSDKFEAYMQKTFSIFYKTCPEFLRHKNFIVNPEILINNGITIYKCIQEPGEFVVTKAGAYHAGFNYGLNCAEAVNFCTSNWINIGNKANSCKCQKQGVEFKLDYFINNIEKQKNKVNEFFYNKIKKMSLFKASITLSKANNLSNNKISFNKKSKSNSILRSSNINNSKNVIKWIMCDNCKKWRIIKNQKLFNLIDLNNTFTCKNINISCSKKEEYWKKLYFTLNTNCFRKTDSSKYIKNSRFKKNNVTNNKITTATKIKKKNIKIDTNGLPKSVNKKFSRKLNRINRRIK